VSFPCDDSPPFSLGHGPDPFFSDKKILSSRATECLFFLFPARMQFSLNSFPCFALVLTLVSSVLARLRSSSCFGHFPTRGGAPKAPLLFRPNGMMPLSFPRCPSRVFPQSDEFLSARGRSSTPPDLFFFPWRPRFSRFFPFLRRVVIFFCERISSRPPVSGRTSRKWSLCDPSP